MLSIDLADSLEVNETGPVQEIDERKLEVCESVTVRQRAGISYEGNYLFARGIFHSIY